MRDILVTLTIFGSLPFILWKPFYGLLVWTWLAFMNPHRMSWGFATTMPFALIVAITTLFSILISKEPKKIPWSRETIVLLVFVVWMGITTVFALYPSLAWEQLDKVWKIQLMIFVVLMMSASRERIDLLIWITVLSLGFYGVKGGIFTIMTGGVHHVRGPPGTFIDGDNHVAVALIMVIPLMRYLQLQEKRAWIRHALTAAMVLTAIAAIGTLSRGAMLGLAGMGGLLWLKSRNKFFTAVLAVVAALIVFNVMPQEWFARMGTIKTYQEDDSAMGRVNTWYMAFNLAKDRPLGGGFETFQRGAFALYAPKPDDVHDAHSIYFEVLGEHGFVGLGLFLLFGLFSWLTASRLAKNARKDPQQRWAADLASMYQVSVGGYYTAGLFVGLAYFDLYYHVVALMLLANAVIARESAVRVGSRSPDDLGGAAKAPGRALAADTSDRGGEARPAEATRTARSMPGHVPPGGSAQARRRF